MKLPFLFLLTFLLPAAALAGPALQLNVPNIDFYVRNAEALEITASQKSAIIQHANEAKRDFESHFADAAAREKELLEAVTKGESEEAVVRLFEAMVASETAMKTAQFRACLQARRTLTETQWQKAQSLLTGPEFSRNALSEIKGIMAKLYGNKPAPAHVQRQIEEIEAKAAEGDSNGVSRGLEELKRILERERPR